MADPRVAHSTTTGGISIAPSLEPGLTSPPVHRAARATTTRSLRLTVLAVLLAVIAAFVARALTSLIAGVTNLAFFGRVSLAPVSPADNHLGALVVLVPAAGALVIGFMSRYGSAAIRGHGIPEAMDQVLNNHSRIPPRVAWLKPLSAAVAIGTGGPFGAEGPIIATGGALGSLLGQVLKVTADERKVLLAAGAAAGMAAIFATPVAAVLLALELLLFEFRPRSLIPVAMACVTATATRFALGDSSPAFQVPDLAEPGGLAVAAYVALGALVGVGSAAVTRLVYAIEDQFAKLPVHWMWWPVLGAIPVGIVGLIAPHTLGVGYDNIEQISSGALAGQALVILGVLKLVSWSICLGSGTSGGTLAPLLTIGGALGALIGEGACAVFPSAGIDPRLAALVGMAAMFAGASRALLASVVFMCEATRQPVGLSLLGACAASFLVSSLLMRHSIMTEKIARRGGRVSSEMVVDFLEQVVARSAASAPVVTLPADQLLGATRTWIAAPGPPMGHQGYPLLDEGGRLVGVITRRDIQDPAHGAHLRLGELVRRPPVVLYEDESLRDAADRMVRERVGRLPVVTRAAPDIVVGMITRSDLVNAHARRLDGAHGAHRAIRLRFRSSRRPCSGEDPGVR